jgi:hypothetical protein
MARKWITGRAAVRDENFRLSHILEPLQPFKDQVISFSNLENKATANSVHQLQPATWLSGVRPRPDATGAYMAPTIDQMIAERIGGDTPLPSLAPLPMEYNPRKVFIQLMGEGDTAAERDALLRKNSSVLDMIAERTNTLRKDLGAGDRAVLSDYLDTVREIERRVEMAGARDLAGVEVPDAPVGELEDFDEQVKLMFDLIALAYQADLTRVASYVMVAEGTNRTYNHVGVPDSFHPRSHHSNDRERIRRLTRSSATTWSALPTSCTTGCHAGR